MIGAAGDVSVTVVPEHIPEVLVGLELEDLPELTTADTAIRVVDVLRPRGPAEKLVLLPRLVPKGTEGVGRVVVRLDSEVRPLGAVRIVLHRLPAGDSPGGEFEVEGRWNRRGSARARADPAEQLVRRKRTYTPRGLRLRIVFTGPAA